MTVPTLSPAEALVRVAESNPTGLAVQELGGRTLTYEALVGAAAAVAEDLAERLEVLPGLRAEAVADKSQPGSGSAPDVFLDSWAVRVQHEALSADALARHLRMGEPCVFTRIADGFVVCDPRTLLEGELEALVGAFEAVCGAARG